MAGSRGSASSRASSGPAASWIAEAMMPTAVEAQNALAIVESSSLARCTMASAKSALTVTHSSTWTDTAAAAIPTSAGPISRATMKAEAKARQAAATASNPDQKTCPATRWLIIGSRGGCAGVGGSISRLPASRLATWRLPGFGLPAAMLRLAGRRCVAVVAGPGGKCPRATPGPGIHVATVGGGWSGQTLASGTCAGDQP